MTQETYTTGSDIALYVAPEGTIPDFQNSQPLDAVGMSIIDEGNVMPLYEYNKHIAKHMAYSVRMVSGTINMNFSSDFVSRFRSPAIQTLRGYAIWAVMVSVDWSPTTRIVRDVVKISHVYEHAFQHSPEPTAMESVPFTARSLSLVARQYKTVDLDQVGVFVNEGNAAVISGDNAFRSQSDQYLATIDRVVDADTYDVVVAINGDQVGPVRVRLIGVDVFEKPTSTKKNKADDAQWRWPSTAPEFPGDPLKGAPAKSPTKEQLDEWGLYVPQIVQDATNGLGLTEGTKVWLVSDPGSGPTEKPGFDPFANTNQEGGTGRYLFQMKTMKGEDVGAWLIENGYATPFYSDSLAYDINNNPYNRLELLDAAYQLARNKAGTSEGKGVWYSFDSSEWDAVI